MTTGYLICKVDYVIPDLVGGDCTAVNTTDRYAAYAFIDAERRQVCWAHLLRDFNRIGQRAGPAGRIGRRLQGLGLVMFRRRQANRLHGPGLDSLQRRLRAALELGAQQLVKGARAAKNCANVLKLWPALWSFTTNPLLQPTNNAAEQALRRLVLKRKISGSTRSLRCDQFLSRGFSVHET